MPHSPVSTDALHPVLTRQIRRHLRGVEGVPAELWPLVQAVSEAYHDADDERRLMANTIEATSAELVDRHERAERGAARLRSIFDHAATGICELSLDGVVLETNPAFQRVLGFTARELQGRAVSSLSQPEEAATLLGPMRELVAGRHGEFTVEQRLTRSDGNPIWCSVSVSKMDLGDGAPRLLAMVQDVSERKELEAQLTRQAFQDSLTGLANRALFRDRVAHALARSMRAGQSLAVLFIDLDNFKTVNDGLGHAAGDRLLTVVGTRLAATMRSGDTVARLGGDEFAVLLENVADESEIHAIVERALSAIRAPVRLGTAEVFVGASIGAAFGRDATTADDLIRNADVAMYAAKSGGKGRCAVFEPGMHERVVERQQLEADLRPALERGEFRVVYQPILELATNRLRGVEALLRWHHPERGIIQPGRFIGVAEETGLIVEIGQWVLEQACEQAAAWRDRFWTLNENGEADFCISVNLSGRQLRDEQLVERVRAALERTELPANMLVLEITESVLVNEMETATHRLEELRTLGVRLAIDDFGTGYSSLSYLQRFPVAVLKIDKSFTDGIGRSAHDAAIVRTIVALAGTLSLAAVAEGVEDGDQHEALMEVGCEFGQGYHFARPVGPAEIEAFMATPRESPTRV